MQSIQIRGEAQSDEMKNFAARIKSAVGIFYVYPAHIYMLFAGWEVRMVKNCDRGLENTARGRPLAGK